VSPWVGAGRRALPDGILESWRGWPAQTPDCAAKGRAHEHSGLQWAANRPAGHYGYLVLVEPGDTDRELVELDMPWRLAEIPWEGASLQAGYIYAV
jgi:hypothetical protein